MIPILLLFIPVLMLVVLANLGQLYRWARWLTYGVLLAMAVMTLAAGIGALLFRGPVPDDLLPVGLAPNLSGVGRWLVLGGALALAPVVVALIAQATSRPLRLSHVDWGQPLPLTAVVLAILFTTLNLSQSALIANAEELAANGSQVGIAELGAQAAVFVMLGVLGVGFGIRRNGRATLARLGVRAVVLPGDVVAVAAATLGLLTMSILVGGILAVMAPESVANATALNSLIFGAISTPAGAILLGLFSGIGEEILYRGALQPAFGLWGASLLFALHHIQYLSFALLVVFLLGLALGWIRNHYGTTVAVGVHAAYNTTLILIALASTGLAPR